MAKKDPKAEKLKEKAISEITLFVKARLDNQSLDDFKTIKKALGFRSDKDLLRLIYEDSNIFDPANIAHSIKDFEGYMRSVDLTTPLIKFRNKLKRTLTEQQLIVYERLEIVITRNFLLFMLSLMKDDESRFRDMSLIEEKFDNTLNEAAYLNIFPENELQSIKAAYLGNLPEMKKIYFGEETIDNRKVIDVPSNYFIWKKDTEKLLELFKSLTNNPDPYFESDQDKFLSLFYIDSTVDTSIKIKWVKTPFNYREVAHLFHKLCDSDLISKGQKRKLNTIISHRLLDNEGKSISHKTLKTSYSSFIQSPSKSQWQQRIEGIVNSLK